MGQRYTIPNKVAGEVADGEAVIMDLSAGRYFSSKNSGAVIWNCVEAGLSQSQIGAKVAELYNLDETAAQTETDTFLDKLMANRLIEPSSEAEPQPIEGAPDIAKSVEWYMTGLDRGDARAGGNAAFLIATEGVDGFDLFDAALIGAKSAALTNQSASAQARQLLGNFPETALNGGAQKLINLLGGDVTADGAFGPASLAATEQVLASYGAGPAVSDPVDRIVQLAAVFWTTSPFRVDLY